MRQSTETLLRRTQRELDKAIAARDRWAGYKTEHRDEWEAKATALAKLDDRICRLKARLSVREEALQRQQGRETVKDDRES